MYMYIRSIDFASVSVIFLLVFVTVLTLWNFVFCFYYISQTLSLFDIDIPSKYQLNP
jgi:hypothetical protein